MNSDLVNLFDYLCLNKLKLNMEKTKTMTIGKKVSDGLSETIQINNSVVENVF